MAIPEEVNEGFWDAIRCRKGLPPKKRRKRKRKRRRKGRRRFGW